MTLDINDKNPVAVIVQQEKTGPILAAARLQ